MAVKCFCDHCGKEIVLECPALDDKVFAVKEASLELRLYLGAKHDPNNFCGCDVQLCGDCFNDFYSYINKYFNIPEDNAPDEKFWNVSSKAIIDKDEAR